MKKTLSVSKTGMAAREQTPDVFIFSIFISMYFAPHVYIIALILLVLIVAIWVFSGAREESDTDSKKKAEAKKYKLNRHGANPVVSPRPHNEWETQGTLNPAAIADSKGAVHLLYRSIGSDGISNIGHAKSKDGLDFAERSSFPVYQPESGTPKPPESEACPEAPQEFNPIIYTSGGGWGGFEDPRAVCIEERVYMTYVDFAGWNSVRIGLTSIALSDLENGKWNWRKPKLISPAGQVNKNWVIFPEKINGKFAILHSIAPDIKIDFVDDLDHMYTEPNVKSSAPRGGRDKYWDNWVRGAGPPPVKTDKGWLLLYHAMDKKDPNKYKIGAMLLDISNPNRILYRSPHPILEPDMPYENDWKPGVVYASGAIVKNGNLIVYYGGGDKHVCLAQTPLKQLLDWLTAYGKV
jgi:beta-1,2-mannobiose phosphorylase / 1,2-beta-oligomannan phosphorylase